MSNQKHAIKNEFPQASEKHDTMITHRSVRLIHMIQLLSVGRGYTIEELSDFYAVDPRTVQRDIGLIRQELQVTIDYNRTTRKYEVRDTHQLLPSVGLTKLEAFSLVVLCREFGLKKSIPFFNTLNSASAKIQGYLSAETNAFIIKTYKNLEMYNVPVGINFNKQEFYRQVTDANRTHNTINIVYKSFTEGKKIKTKVNPYQVIFNHRNWFCIGYSSAHNQIRMFNVGRILELEIGPTFEYPHDWTLAKYLRNAWNIIPEDGPDYHVIIDFTRIVGGNVEEIFWHKNQKTHWIDENTLRFETVVSGLKEISWWILGYGAEATVVQPPELRQMIADHVARLYKEYKPEITKR